MAKNACSKLKRQLKRGYKPNMSFVTCLHFSCLELIIYYICVEPTNDCKVQTLAEDLGFSFTTAAVLDDSSDEDSTSDEDDDTDAASVAS